MEIEIKVSNTMSTIGGAEHSLIRIPTNIAEANNISIGEFLTLRHRCGGIETLQVDVLLPEDLNDKQTCAYVTKKTHNKLFIRGRNAPQRVSQVENITLGCDPEAFLVESESGTVQSAHRFFRKNGGVGHDGLLLEFRPSPHEDADIVCRNIAGLITEARRILNVNGQQNIIMLAASAVGNLTAGFHLHYGLPKTFEFRMPGGINLIHPALTKGLLSLGAVVAEDVASRINTCTDCFVNMSEMVSREDLLQLYPNLPDTQTSFNIVCNPDIGLARSYLNRIIEDVRKMVGYEKRKQAVEEYFSRITNGETFSNNIEINWGGVYHGIHQHG
jgi:hypothetical protein